MKRTEIRITGFGGQGVVLCGHIIGHACSICEDKHATMIQSFGPEARGSACSCTLVVSADEVLYPYVQDIDVFVVMSSEGYAKFADSLKPGGTLIYESDLVQPRLREGQPSFGITSTRIAEELGRRLVQNIVMLGFFGAVTGIARKDSLAKAVEHCVPAGTEELNLKAFNAGWDYFEQNYGEAKAGKRKAAKATSD